jgi:hypothetical protein
MDIVFRVLGSAEFWMGMSLIALALPGPQTRILPWILRGIAEALTRRKGDEGQP